MFLGFDHVTFVSKIIKRRFFMLPINPILAASAANMAVGMLWYSDYAFGPLWRKL